MPVVRNRIIKERESSECVSALSSLPRKETQYMDRKKIKKGHDAQRTLKGSVDLSRISCSTFVQKKTWC